MLRFLRKYSSSIGVKILYGVLALLFVIWGVGAIGSDTADVVARVHGEAITRREVDRTAAAVQERYRDIFRGRLDPRMLEGTNFRAQALDELIDNALIRHEAEQLGVTVSDAELLEAMRRLPELQDPERRRMLNANKHIAAALEEDIRRALERRRVQGLVGDGAAVSDAEIAERYRQDHERFDLVFVRIPSADLAKDLTPSDQELAAHLEANAERYREPARVRVRYAAFRPADFAAEVKLTDGEIAEYYELQKEDRFTTPEEVRARHILVKLVPGASDEVRAATRTKAEDLLAKVRGGADVAALAKAHSEDPASAAQGGDLGFFPRGRMVPAFDAAAFALEPGAVSELVETPFGFHVIKLEERRPGGVKPLEAVRAEIVETLTHERAFDLARKRAEQVRRAVVGGAPFAEATGDAALTETPPFAAGEEVSGVGRVEEFSTAAFALGPNQVSDLIETDTAIYLLTPFEHLDARTPPLADIRDRVTTDVRQERGAAAARARAEQVLARARELGLERAAAEAGVPTDSTGTFDRRGGIPKLGGVANLRSDALALTSEAPLGTQVYTLGTDAVVVALRERTPADMGGLDAEREQIRQTLLQQKRGAAIDAYMDLLKEQAHREGSLEVMDAQAERG